MRRLIWFVTMLTLLIFNINSVLSQTKNKNLAVVKVDPSILNLDSDIFQQRIEMYILKNYPENHKMIVIECDSLPTPIPVNLVDWEIKVKTQNNYVKTGDNTVEITVFSSKDIYTNFEIIVEVKTFDDIVVAAEQLQPAQKISENKVILARMETTRLKRNYFLSLTDVIDLKTIEKVEQGQPVWPTSIELPFVIRKGDVIKIIVKVNNMQVTSYGKALQNGKKGDRIEIVNQDTGKKLKAEVIDKQTVIVEL